MFGPACDVEVEALPATVVYLSMLKQQFPEAMFSTIVLLRFKVPHLDGREYSGPSPAQLRANADAQSAHAMAAAFDAEGLRALADQHQVYWDVIKPAVEKADLNDPQALAFVAAIGDVVAARGHNRVVAEAALRTGDEAPPSSRATKRAWSLDARASSVARESG